MGLTRQQARALGIEWPKDMAKKPIGGMNKTEARFAEMCKVWATQFSKLEWEFEPMKLRLAGKTFYTPDFRISYVTGFGIAPLLQHLIIEVKARDKNGKVLARDDALVKLKTAAELHPFPFYLASYGKTGWKIDLLPSRRWGHLWEGLVTPW